jgi:hypothetical protein
VCSEHAAKGQLHLSADFGFWCAAKGHLSGDFGFWCAAKGHLSGDFGFWCAAKGHLSGESRVGLFSGQASRYCPFCMAG